MVELSQQLLCYTNYCNVTKSKQKNVWNMLPLYKSLDLSQGNILQMLSTLLYMQILV